MTAAEKIRDLARDSIRFIPTPVYYALTGSLTRLRRPLALYPERVRIDVPRPHIDGFNDCEALFARSGDHYEAFVKPFAHEFHWTIGRLYNGFFDAGDPELYYAIIRKHRPKLVIEVGSGHSTLFARDAVEKNGHGRIMCIDPEPLRKPPRGTEHLKARVEQIDWKVFAELEAGDILFVDSSHTTEEARYHVEHILPKLNKGVLVHHHDITYPFAIYWRGDRQLYGEPDVLLDFYKKNQASYEVLISTSYIRYREPERWSRLVPSYWWNPTRTPGSLWSVKRA